MLIRLHIRTITLTFRRGASLLLPLHRMLSPSQPLQKDNYPSPRTKLASLAKGEVLSPEKIRATTGGIASRCTKPLHSHNHRKRTIIPSPRTTTLASPRKRGGGTADIIFSLAVQYSDSPAFTILKLFRAVTVGIVIDKKF